ncbi:MAG TPA: hypothetical protein PLL10_05065 [Elusimicrobiales bacterium]|nr:hypothetical protein [Elusimicrobiales bacterium]
MEKLLYLTCGKHRDLIPEERALPELLRRRGLDAHIAAWDEEDWDPYGHILIRTPWNYAEKPKLFLEKMARATALGANIMHSEKIIRWNIDKNYLAEFYKAGLPVAPTFVENNFTRAALRQYHEKFGELVVKPRIGAGGQDTFRVAPDEPLDRLSVLEGRAVLVQPYIPEIASEGEHSFIFFEERFSHAAVKKPAAGEFRVQEIHGGTSRPYSAPSREIAEAETLLKAAKLDTLYARVDMVKRKDRMLLMELEIFEPQLFLDFAPHAREQFAAAVARRCTSNP